jgi:small-conductance mechanosensitive channel
VFINSSASLTTLLLVMALQLFMQSFALLNQFLPSFSILDKALPVWHFDHTSDGRLTGSPAAYCDLLARQVGAHLLAVWKVVGRWHHSAQ